ncbi:MAG TPA: hypothetical protein PLB31_00790 [Fimbriimonadaceae bacterium]|nr:hypothetical protein [Armatimonadota bacterium]HRD32282.1 hypothetical protein [Fimbriimonadaceae bacterium]HRE93406.1 hypothetical protein [Fimbriimonadaceae bacterium]HRI72986.1 hypothetical protein [Fimbriimonadaceae bacterium]
MNSQQARDLFSEYREGTLEAGLREQFERALRQDASLRKDYEQFCAILMALEGGRDEVIEVPLELSRRITESLETATPAPRRFNIIELFRSPLGYGVAAAVVLIPVILISLNRGGGSNASQASMLGGSTVPTRSEFRMVESELSIVLQSPKSDQLEVRDGLEGPVEQTFEVGAKTLRQAFTNAKPEAQGFWFDFKDDTLADRYVVMPGRTLVTTQEGEGSILDLATAISNHQGIAIEVANPSSESTFKWNLTPEDNLETMVEKLRVQGLALSDNVSDVFLLTE